MWICVFCWNVAEHEKGLDCNKKLLDEYLVFYRWEIYIDEAIP